MKNRKITVFIIQGYEQRTDTGQLIDAVQLELIDESYEKALARAKKLIKKTNYRLSNVIENYI